MTPQELIKDIERFKIKKHTLTTFKGLEAKENALKEFWVLCKGDIVINKSQWRTIKKSYLEAKSRGER